MSADDFIETDPDFRDYDDVLRALIERHSLILAMQETEGWRLWRDYLAAAAGGYQRRLLYGQHKEMLDYRYDAGVLHGIRIALDADQTLAKQIAGQRSILDESTALEEIGALALEDTNG